jgi:elongation factor Ts
MSIMENIKELRQSTGAGLMDCKKALQENDGDLEGAIDWLRKKGLSKAAKKAASRVAAEGLVAVHVSGNKGSVVEINSETDFVARNEQFQKFVSDVAVLSHEAGSVEALASTTYPNTTHAVSEELTNLVATIGEHLSLRRCDSVSVDNGKVVHYIHGKVSDIMGRIGVLVALESTGSAETLEILGKNIAMHIAASAPSCLHRDEMDQALVQKERDIFAEQAKASGKPEHFIEKMTEGRIIKFYKESVLLEQSYALDNSLSVEEAIKAAAKDMGTDITLKAYKRFEIGEGIEKEESDFAAEVQAQLA